MKRVLKVKSMSGMSAEKTRRFPEWVLKALLPCLRATPIGQVSHEKGVESFKEAGLRGDKICAVSREMGVEKEPDNQEGRFPWGGC
jgi:hypothetical protein